MSKGKIYPNILLVEGDSDKRVIPEFVEKNGINWETSEKQPIVFIKSANGEDKLLDINIIKTELKKSRLQNLGIVIDADNEPKNRIISINNICNLLKEDSDFGLSNNLTQDGFIFRLNSGIKFGIWIMPDNQNQGMLETFLSYLITENNPQNNLLWQYTKQVVQEAKKRGATYKDVHLDKAQIHTWLAWQDEPGRQLHDAIKFKILNPQHPKGQSFFRWFKQLYNL
ncbi:DUF3226 domain-containing protein [Geminocystis sp. CENA526]|uniref:DUF3226 domain-containing protein n=1 Tax=Geminocystis sp. CENA526 TaxID=1355871 RepID=UPI003D6F730B